MAERRVTDRAERLVECTRCGREASAVEGECCPACRQELDASYRNFFNQRNGVTNRVSKPFIRKSKGVGGWV